MIFISDIHLSEKNLSNTNRFINFLKYYLNDINSLYILGDLFDIWIGDDNKNSFNIKIANELFSLKKRNISCYFVPGNHDFLIGKYYAESCGMTILPEKKIFKFFKKRIIIMHGDSLCENDYYYQIFKKLIQSKFIKNIFLSLPLYLRFKIFNFIKLNFLFKKKKKNNIKINKKKILEIFYKTKVDIMIHGHIHKEKIFYFKKNNKNFYRAVLGSWYKQASAIKVTKSKLKFIKINFK